jgi:hypothetical protein
MSKSRFLYHAFAAGLSGKIHRPFEEVLEVQAPSALPPSGGVSSGSARDIRIRDLFHCASVVSSARGEFHPATDTFETRVSATLEQFNLAGIVTADLIRARVHSSHSQDESAEPSIVLDGSAIINLKIHGTPIELENFSELYTDLNTMEKLRQRHRTDRSFREQVHEWTMAGRSEELAEHRLHRYFPFCKRKPTEDLHETRHAAILPLFRVMTKSGPGFTVFQNVVHIENFGRLHLGELIISPNERRVTGLHIDLGSPTGGEVDGCSVGANGGHADPPPEGSGT